MYILLDYSIPTITVSELPNRDYSYRPFKIVDPHDASQYITLHLTVSSSPVRKIVKQNQTLNSNSNSLKYKLISLLRYNIDLAPGEINDYLIDVNHANNLKRFIRSEQYLNDIYFDETISMFQDLNALYFLYHEETPPTSKKLATTATTPMPHSTTKRIIMNDKSHNRKTRRNLINTNNTTQAQPPSITHTQQPINAHAQQQPHNPQHTHRTHKQHTQQ